MLGVSDTAILFFSKPFFILTPLHLLHTYILKYYEVPIGSFNILRGGKAYLLPSVLFQGGPRALIPTFATLSITLPLLLFFHKHTVPLPASPMGYLTSPLTEP